MFELTLRAAEEERRKREEAEAAALQVEESVLSANPLVGDDTETESFTIKKRWYDDTIFKNQARNEPDKKKRFINDTIRSDFHRKFLNKYVK